MAKVTIPDSIPIKDAMVSLRFGDIQFSMTIEEFKKALEELDK